VHHQEFEQRKFLRAQINGPACTLYRVGETIQLQVGYLQDGFPKPSTAAKHSPNARRKLGKGKRLG